MFDLSWGELLLIGGVAVVVMKPQDIPGALHTFGQQVAKLRRMASQYQGQFQEAMREANLDEVKKDFDEIRQATSSIRSSLTPAGFVGSQVRNTLTSTASETTGSLNDIRTSLSASPSATSSSTPLANEESDLQNDEDVEIPSAFALNPAFRRH